MSIKIVPAWKLPSGTDPFALVPIVRTFAANKVQEGEELKVHNELSRLLDYAAIEEAPAPETPAATALITVNKQRDPFSQENISTYLFKDQKTGSLLVLGNTTVLYELALNLDWQDFHYRDDIDKPTHISDEEWKTRKETWERVYPKGAAGNYGLLIETNSVNYIHSVTKARFINDSLQIDNRADRLVNLILRYGKPEGLTQEQIITAILTAPQLFSSPSKENKVIIQDLTDKIRILRAEDYTNPVEPTTTLTKGDLQTAWNRLIS